MDRVRIGTMVRTTSPHAITAVRVICGGAALFAAHYQEARIAATLITLGSITDGIDGPLARKLKVTSEFGAAFDYFADYLCYIIAPALLSLVLIKPPVESWMLVMLGLPLLAGALRYPKNLVFMKSQDFAKIGTRGLGTVFYAYFMVTLVFTELDKIIGDKWFNGIILVIVTIVSCLMVTAVRYVKAPRPILFVGLLVGLSMMPFVYPRILAGIALAAGFLFVFFYPFFGKRSGTAAIPAESGIDKERSCSSKAGS